MANPARASFQAALIRYRRARAGVKAGQSERQRDRAIAKLDEALDFLISSPSPSLGAFGAKIQILEAEYGIEAQPRHWKAVYVDVLVALVPIIAAAELALGRAGGT